MPNNDVVSVATARIPEVRWRDSLTHNVVLEVVGLYISRNHPGFAFQAQDTEDGLNFRISAPQAYFHVRIKGGIVLPTQEPNSETPQNLSQFAQELAAEITEVLEFTADMYFQRAMQHAVLHIGTGFSPSSSMIDLNGKKQWRTMYTIHLPRQKNATVRVLPLSHGVLEISAGGEEIDLPCANEAISYTIAQLKDQGIALELVPDIKN